MATVTIPKVEYQTLKRQSLAYKRLAARVFETAVKDDVTAAIKDFADTGLYTRAYLAELEEGLRKSSYARA
jgi:hypothetical protein